MTFKVGDKVRVIAASHGWGIVDKGDIGTIVESNHPHYRVEFQYEQYWSATESDLELVKKVVEYKRKAKKLVPKNYREQVAVRLIQSVTQGPGKFTAVKVESEGRMNRGDHCTKTCKRRIEGKPHLGCKYFHDVKVANDFILKYLADFGLAVRCKPGEHVWSYFYKPLAPLVFSKVYTDSETEWTVTLSLENAEDVLFTPVLVDAFNALAQANGNPIDVNGSGMHTAFLQGRDGMYPDHDRDSKAPEQNKMFENFAKSMRPLLPALYLLGANRMENGKCITRSLTPRAPLVSSSEKYSAIAYRYGAVEFRIFDTCYDNRDQILDNIVVMSQAISKYWRKKYHNPNVLADKPVIFGGNNLEINRINPIENLYVVRDHVVLLNKGLRCIKPPYSTVKEIKQARNFSLTVRSVKDIINTKEAQEAFDRHVVETRVNRAVREARELYSLLDNGRYNSQIDTENKLKSEMRKFRKSAKDTAKRKHPLKTIENIAYENKFGSGYMLGETA